MLENNLKYKIGAAILLFFASIKVIADLLGLGQVSALAAATNLSPAMKVFTAHKSYETYSSTYILKLEYTDTTTEEILLNPEVYSHLEGPYNRRNVYGAAVAYGPILKTNPATEAMWNSVVLRSFCEKKSTAGIELGFDATKDVASVTVRYEATKDPQDFPQEIQLNCQL